MKKIYIYLTCLLLTSVSYAQIEPIMIEAEDASIIGSDFEEVDEGDTTYLTPSTDFANADYPGTADKVLTFDVPFETAGTYHLYVKVRVGPDGPNDDSFYFANSFGDKNPEDIADWIKVNNIQNGANHPDSVITDGVTSVGNEVFKWVNASLIGGGDTPVETAFEVSGAGDEVFQYGAREDALDIDKIAFGEAGVAYTVADLESAGADVPNSLSSSMVDDTKMKVYPNPASDYITVTFTDKALTYANIEIYGQTGALVKSFVLNNQHATINIEDLSSGLYIMKAYINGENYSEKLIIR